MDGDWGETAARSLAMRRSRVRSDVDDIAGAGFCSVRGSIARGGCGGSTAAAAAGGGGAGCGRRCAGASAVAGASAACSECLRKREWRWGTLEVAQGCRTRNRPSCAALRRRLTSALIACCSSACRPHAWTPSSGAASVGSRCCPAVKPSRLELLSAMRTDASCTVVSFQPKYLTSHAEKYLLSLSTKYFLDQNVTKKCICDFEN